MEYRLAQLAEILDVELRGDGDLTISTIATLASAQIGALSFLANSRYKKHLPGTQASAVILSPEDADAAPCAALISNNPYYSYAKAAELIYPLAPGKAGVHPTAVIEKGASIHTDAWIGPHCYIEAGAIVAAGVTIGPGCYIGANSCIGEDSQLVSNVSILAASQIGNRAMLHSGVVIGSEGFGMAKTNNGWDKVPQLGSVRIGDDVDVGANTTIDRGSIEDTLIGEGVKIDNQVQIGHNVEIGKHTAIAGCVGISGSAKIGCRCTLAGGVGLVGHLSLADDVHITAMSMVTRSILTAGTYSAGTPLMKNKLWLRVAARFKKLDQIATRIDRVYLNQKKSG